MGKSQLITTFLLFIQSSFAVEFDFYLLVQSWQPEFCSNQNYPGCVGGNYDANHLTLHGLWPNYAQAIGGTTYPSFCNSQAIFNASSIPDSLLNEMETYWPNVQYDVTDPNYDSFWSHEWLKHGTCTSLAQNDFFTAAINLEMQMQTPDIIVNNVGGSVNLQDLTNAYSFVTAFQCDSSSYLNSIITCWSKDENDVPQAQIDCPDDVTSSLNTCTSSQVQIVSF